MTLEVRLLGSMELRYGGSPLPLPSTSRARSLLAYLIVHRAHPQSREHLADLFWPHRSHTKSLRSLSTALWRVRRILPLKEYILADAYSLQFNPRSDYWLDVHEFQLVGSEALPWTAHRAETPSEKCERLQRAVELYRGDFLEGFYDDWCLEERYRLEGLYFGALERLAIFCEKLDRPEEALRYAQRLLARDPLREDMHRIVIRLYTYLGNRAAALQQARHCRRVLRSELGVEPEAETTALCDALLGPAWRHLPDRTPSMSVTPPSVAPSEDPLTYPPFVGREVEWSLLRRRWEAVRAGLGTVILMSGEAGIGKTRMVEEFARYVGRKGGWVVQANCYEYEHALPYGPLVDLLRRMLTISQRHALHSLSPWQAADLSRLAPDLVPPPYLDDDRHGLPSESDQTRLFQALTSLMLDIARHNPLLVVLEDLQWAHPSVRAWLHYLARHISKATLLGLVTYRPGEAEPAHAVADLEHRLVREKRAVGIALSRLSPAALTQWMQGVGSTVVTEIYRHTEGNPFFVLETQRTLLDEGKLLLEGGRWSEVTAAEHLPVPDSVRQAIRRRLRRLSTSAEGALRVAAVIGRSFDFETLQEAWGEGEETALEALDELLRRRLVREGEGPFGKDYRFDHHLVRETVYAAMPLPTRRRLHRRVAEALLMIGRMEPVASAEVAYHYIQAEAWSEALEHLLRAGDEAGRIAADSEALTYYRQAILAYERAFGNRWEPLSRAVLGRKMGETFFRCGEHSQAMVHLERAVDLLGRPLPAGKGALHREMVLALLRQIGHRFKALWPRRQSSLSLIPPAVEEEVRIYFDMGWIHALEANYEPYLLVSLRALNRSESAGYARGMALAASALGMAADFIPLFWLAGYYHRYAARSIIHVDHPGTIGFVYQGLAYHHHLLGEHEAAFAYAQQSAEAYRRGDDPHRWALSQLLIAYTYEYGGDFERALHTAQEILHTGEEVADAWVLCVGHEIMGVVQQRQGALDEAVGHLRQAIALAERIPDYLNLVEASGELAKCYLLQGRWQEAVAMLERRRQVIAEQDVYGDSLSRFLDGLAESYLAAAEHASPSARSDWLSKAGSACRNAWKQGRAFRTAAPEAARLRGRYDWLRGRQSTARRWWQRSLTLAETLQQPYDVALTYLEMGRYLKDDLLLQRAEALFAEMGIEWRAQA